MLAAGVACSQYLPTFYDLMKASFDRTILTSILADRLGRYRVTDISTDEMMLISYAYDEQQPRFYSEHFAKKNPYLYDLQMDKAVIGASSLLMYFDPYAIQLGVSNQETLVDGAIIAENPSFYAALQSKEFNQGLLKTDYVRVVSLGSGYRKSFYDRSFVSGDFIKQVFNGADEVIDLFNYIKA